MRILGIDPGLAVTGYACVSLEDGALEPALVEAGVFRLDRRASIPARLAQLYEDLCGVLVALDPQHVAVEQLFAHYRHARTAIVMGHARGAVLLAAQQHRATLSELAATEVKKAIAGNGHASKRQMQAAVTVQCGLPEVPEPPDVADAIAIALCAARRIAAERLVGA